METKELTVGQKLSEEVEEKILLIELAFASILIGAVAFLLEPLGLIQPTRTWATWLLVAAAFFASWLCVRYLVSRMENIYNADLNQRQMGDEKSAERLGWLKKYVQQVHAILNNKSWVFYLESVAQEPIKSKQLESFDGTLNSLLSQMAEIRKLDETGLVYDAISSRILHDLRWALQYTRRTKADPGAEGAWNTRIAEVAATLM